MLKKISIKVNRLRECNSGESYIRNLLEPTLELLCKHSRTLALRVLSCTFSEFRWYRGDYTLRPLNNKDEVFFYAFIEESVK